MVGRGGKVKQGTIWSTEYIFENMSKVSQRFTIGLGVLQMSGNVARLALSVL